eukprot:222095-Pleurochrysis_carterae.AAC.1
MRTLAAASSVATLSSCDAPSASAALTAARRTSSLTSRSAHRSVSAAAVAKADASAAPLTLLICSMACTRTGASVANSAVHRMVSDGAKPDGADGNPDGGSARALPSKRRAKVRGPCATQISWARGGGHA